MKITKNIDMDDLELMIRFDIHEKGKNIAYAIVKPNSTEGDGPFIAGLHVKKSHQGRFLSKLLLKEIEKEFSGQTLRLFAKPYKDKSMSQERLIRLYELFGFSSEENDPSRMYKNLKSDKKNKLIQIEDRLDFLARNPNLIENIYSSHSKNL